MGVHEYSFLAVGGRGILNSNGIEIEAVFFTPFASGSLSEKLLLARGEQDVELLVSRLNARTGHSPWWEVSGPPGIALQGYGEPLHNKFRSRMPRSLLRVKPASALASMQQPRVHVHRHPGVCGFRSSVGTEWSLLCLEFDLWNIGAGLMTSRYSVTKPPSMSWEEFGAIAIDLKTEARDDLTPWMESALDGSQFEMSRVGWVDEETANEEFWSQPLWTHDVFIVMGTRLSSRDMKGIAERIVEVSKPCDLGKANEHVVIRTGLNSCIVGNKQSRSVVEKSLWVIGAHNVCWAAATRVDSYVSDELLALEIRDRSDSQLGQETAQLLGLTEKARLVLATVEDVNSHLQVLDSTLWRFIDEGWEFPDYRRNLEKRLTILRELHAEIIAQLSGRRLRSLNQLALVLGIIGVVGIVPGVMAMFDKEGALGLYIMASLGVVGALTLLFFTRRKHS